MSHPLLPSPRFPPPLPGTSFIHLPGLGQWISSETKECARIRVRVCMRARTRTLLCTCYKSMDFFTIFFTSHINWYNGDMKYNSKIKLNANLLKNVKCPYSKWTHLSEIKTAVSVCRNTETSFVSLRLASSCRHVTSTSLHLWIFVWLSDFFDNFY